MIPGIAPRAEMGVERSSSPFPPSREKYSLLTVGQCLENHGSVPINKSLSSLIDKALGVQEAYELFIWKMFKYAKQIKEGKSQQNDIVKSSIQLLTINKYLDCYFPCT